MTSKIGNQASSNTESTNGEVVQTEKSYKSPVVKKEILRGYSETATQTGSGYGSGTGTGGTGGTGSQSLTHSTIQVVDP